MESTIAHLCHVEELSTRTAVKYIEIGPDLPIDFFPRNSIGFPHISYEFFKVPFFVNDMFGSDLSIEINKRLAFITR